ncbi:hypothetical protein KC349_g221 [Hortaea werneckii]|nr:hypothetical protein KC349_g221 [Hortaea werneckii]
MSDLRNSWIVQYITVTRRSPDSALWAVRFSSSLLAIGGAVLASEEVLLLDRSMRAKEGAALDSQLCPMPRIAATLLHQYEQLSIDLEVCSCASFPENLSASH